MYKTWYLFAINNYIDTQVARRGRQYRRNSKKIIITISYTTPYPG